MNEQKINGKEKLWKIEIGRENDVYTFYIVSVQKPMIIFESPLGKLRKIFEIFPQKSQPQQPPIFFVSSKENATVELAEKMHGYKLQKITSDSIVLSIDNPQNKDLYEISLFKRKQRSFIRKKYILAAHKKEIIKISQDFKKDYIVTVKKAKKMDCYPILSLTENEIVLKRVK